MYSGENRKAQDGRIGVSEKIEMRVSVLPSVLGEKAVMRVLDRSGITMDPSKIGMTESNLDMFRRGFTSPNGIVLLTGPTGSGKTTLSRFVAWMNGLSVYQIKVHNKYTAEDFDEDLRQVLRRSGCKDEKICFIMDESNVLDSSFLERMNTLLANGEVILTKKNCESSDLLSI